MTDVPVLPRNRRTAAFERRVARALTVHLAALEVPPDASVVVACSGGPDSTATLVAVARARPAGTVVAAHFDHRLRPAAEVAAERAVVGRVALAAGAAVLAGRAARVPGDRGEAAAREARYRWLARACATAGAALCVTGHTLDDQAETVLLRLARGTGLAGVAGMDGRARWPVAVRGAAPHLVRPLLAVPRREVEAYLDALGVEPARDPSNDTLDYARNRVRTRVLPQLRAVNPRAAEQIAAFAAGARDDEAALDAWAARALSGIARDRDGAGGRVDHGTVRLDRTALLELPAAVAARVVRLAAGRLGAALEREQVIAALHAARAHGRRAALPGGIEAAREGDALVLRQRGQLSGNLPVTH